MLMFHFNEIIKSFEIAFITTYIFMALFKVLGPQFVFNR